MKEALLRSAAQEVRSAMLDALPTDLFPVSPAFEQRMAPLLRAPSIARRASPFPVKAAIVAAVLCCAALSVPTVRAELRRWSLEVRTDVRVHYFTGDPIEEPLPWYAIGVFPEGYYLSPEREIVESSSGDFRSIRYENDAGQYLYFDYGYMEQGAASVLYLDEGDTLVETTVNGYSAEICLTDTPETSRNLITWIVEEDNMDFSIMGHFSAAELVEMAESVYIEKKR